MKNYLKETILLDYNYPSIQSLIQKKNWRVLDRMEQIQAIYNFVRDDIQFGFNLDEIPASDILKEGIGQCNTKTILFMALLRAVGAPCRLHGFTIDKKLQAGIMNGPVFEMMPNEIVHTWTEVYYNEQWYDMEGLILDLPYLRGLQHKFAHVSGTFSGYAVATTDLHNPVINWNGNNNTYIQKEGILQDFGVFETPDDFFAQHGQAVTPEKREVFNIQLRHRVNEQIRKIRELSA